MKSHRIVLGTLMLALLQGCALLPPEPVVTGPLTAVPHATPRADAELNGAIYQPAVHGSFPLFEDRRPRNVGDVVNVIIQEKTHAAKNVQTTTARTGRGGFGVKSAPGLLPGALGTGLAFDMTGENESSGTGASRADNVFSGSVTATVIDVLPNGNLRIAGEKQMAINRGSEHIRFSGVVDPRFITASGSVLSTQVADARIAFRSKGAMDEVQAMGWLQRFFLNIAPF